MNIFKRIWSYCTESGEPNPHLMIKHMLDKESDDLGGRDDCAMYLCKYDLPEVEQALISVVTDTSIDEMIADSAIESLIEIWNRQERTIPKEVLVKLRPDVKVRFENVSA